MAPGPAQDRVCRRRHTSHAGARYRFERRFLGRRHRHLPRHDFVAAVSDRGRSRDRGELDIRMGTGESRVEVAPVPNLKRPVEEFDVLLRNSRSPRLRGRGFERNALAEALELAHEAFGDVLLIFAS
jgi:hypothetical protein